MRKLVRPIVIFFIITFMFSFKVKDDPNSSDSGLPYQIAIVDSKQMNANNISTWFRNNGSFNRDPYTGNSGFEWPKGSSKFITYASGLWLIGKVGNDTFAALAEYDYEYLPGYVDNNGNPQGKDDSLYRVYSIYKGDSLSKDYLEWPVQQGAYLDANGKPFLPGEQTMFMCYTDGYPESHVLNYGGGTLPLKAQVQLTNWTYKESPGGILSNTIFSEFKVINRSSRPWNDAIVSLWSDETGEQVALGCDTILKLGYAYCMPNSQQYGTKPPAYGMQVLKGPEIYTGNNNDTSSSFKLGENKFKKRIGYREVNYSSFHTYNNSNPSNGDPGNIHETYLVMQAIWSNGTPWTLPGTSTVTKYPFSGDPESGAGWIQYPTQGFGNRRIMLNMNIPVFNPGDTQTIIIAQLAVSGSNNLNAVTRFKQQSKTLRNFYKAGFNKNIQPPPNPVSKSYSVGNSKIYLSWNDTSEKVTAMNLLSGGTYKFQGYNIYQINSYSTSPKKEDTVLIKTYDLQDGIGDIYDSMYLPEYNGVVYGLVQKGSNNGISRYIKIDRDTISQKSFINGTEYKFAVTAYYYDPLGGIFTLPKVYETPKNVIKVTPQGINAATGVSYDYGDTLITDQLDEAVMPVVVDPLKLMSASYTSSFGGTFSNPNWTLRRTTNGATTTLFENVFDFSGQQDTAKTFDGLMLIHQTIRDSGIVKDPGDSRVTNTFSNFKGWTYEPSSREWFEGPDSASISTAKVLTGRLFDSRSLGMCFPTLGTFRNLKSRISANGRNFLPGTTTTTMSGGPLRKIQIVFEENSLAYRYVPADTNLNNTPYADMVDVPFSVYATDELDSTNGNPRQLNVAFVDADSSGTWNPDTSALGGYEFTFVLASDYSQTPISAYTVRNIMLGSPSSGFPGFDVMYVWLPRVKKINGVPQTWNVGDKLTVTPYRITRPDFVPGYPVKYSWTVNGTTFNNTQNAIAEVSNIKAFPNPYFGFSELEYNDEGDKFIYFSHLPARCDIYVYTLDGVLAKKIERNTNDPGNTLEKWDLKNDNGSYVASGMYLVYIDCKELGAKVLKIAVFQNKF